MAARKNPNIVQKTRDRIQTTQLLKRLQDYALGKLELDPGRVRAIEILLKKTLADMKSMEIEVTEPVRVVVERIERDKTAK